MTVKEVKTIAKNVGVAPGTMKKEQLIQSIQVAEGNTPCFNTNDGSCPEMECLWRADCLK